MSTIVKSLLGDYSQAVSQFQAASMGSYAGPSTPIGLLGDMVGSVDGINPEDLVASTASAMGARRPWGGGSGLKEFLLGTVLTLAGGAIMDRLRGVQDDFEEERREADDLVESAQQCSDAIEDVVDVSDSALTELISAVIPLINILTMLLQRHPLGKLIAPGISSIGSDLIEQTNDTITQTCRDRDTAIENCYCEFERRCSEVCERELPETPPNPECGREEDKQECPQPSPEPCEPTAPATPTAPAQPAAPAAPSSPPAPSQPSEPEPTPKPQPSDEPEATWQPVPEKDTDPQTEPQQVSEPCPPETTPQSVATSEPKDEVPEPKREFEPETAEDTVKPCGCQEEHEEKNAHSCGCDKSEKSEEEQDCTTTPADAGTPIPVEEVPSEELIPPEQPVEPEEPEQPEDTDTVEEGAEDCEDSEEAADEEECTPEQSCSGVLGILGVGIALVGLGLLADAAKDFFENLPEPEFEPEPEPAPEPEPEPAPEPEPELAPPSDDGVIAPPPELNTVPEPTPPPEKIAHVQAAEAPAPAAPAPEPNTAPPMEQHDVPEAPSSESPSVHARKAGQW